MTIKILMGIDETCTSAIESIVDQVTYFSDINA